MFGASSNMMAQAAQAKANQRANDLQRVASERALVSQRLYFDAQRIALGDQAYQGQRAKKARCHSCGANEWHASVCQYCGGS